jgi:hypothetical protein
VFVVQADHQFWIGKGISDLFVHLREAGASLSETRRGIERDRMAILPIPLEPVTRTVSRAEAKAELGISHDTVVLLSIARAVKYTPVAGPSFPEVAESILEKHQNAVLVAVGPSNTGEWLEASRRTQGRVRALGQRSDTALFYQAADIYLDSFPFTSNTSLLEAGGFGIPLVSYFPYSHDSDVIGPGSPGLSGTLIRATTLEAYRGSVSRAIEDEVFRLRTGERTKEHIRHHHGSDGWHHHLETVYRAIGQSATRVAVPGRRIGNRSEEVDVLLNRLYAGHAALGWVIGWYARRLPYRTRMLFLMRMLRVDRSFSFGMFLPKGFGEYLGRRLKGWRRLPWVARWLSARNDQERKGSVEAT